MLLRDMGTQSMHMTYVLSKAVLINSCDPSNYSGDKKKSLCFEVNIED